MTPEGLLSRAASQYIEGKNLVDMIKENLVAERVAIETYREMVRYFGDKDFHDPHDAGAHSGAGGRACERHA